MEKIEFIIPTYQRMNHLMTTISSITAQTSDRWKIHVVADCSPEGTLERVIEYFKNEPRIKFTILPKRYNDWGHTPRNYGMLHATEEWVVMTGEDNYYAPVFVEDMLKAGDKNSHFVFCNMVHNWTNFQYYPIDCAPQTGKIDIGNFMVRSKYGKQIKLDTKYEQADGKYVEEYIKKFPHKNIIKVNKFLYVHN